MACSLPDNPHSQEATIRSGWEWLPEVDGKVEHIIMVISTALHCL